MEFNYGAHAASANRKIVVKVAVATSRNIYTHAAHQHAAQSVVMVPTASPLRGQGST